MIILSMVVVRNMMAVNWKIEHLVEMAPDLVAFNIEFTLVLVFFIYGPFAKIFFCSGDGSNC